MSAQSIEQLRTTKSQLTSKVVEAEQQSNLSAELEQEIVDFMALVAAAFAANFLENPAALKELSDIYDYFTEVLVLQGVRHNAIPGLPVPVTELER